LCAMLFEEPKASALHPPSMLPRRRIFFRRCVRLRPPRRQSGMRSVIAATSASRRTSSAPRLQGGMPGAVPRKTCRIVRTPSTHRIASWRSSAPTTRRRGGWRHRGRRLIMWKMWLAAPRWRAINLSVATRRWIALSRNTRTCPMLCVAMVLGMCPFTGARQAILRETLRADTAYQRSSPSAPQRELMANPLPSTWLTSSHMATWATSMDRRVPNA